MKLKRVIRAVVLSAVFFTVVQEVMAQNKTIRGSVFDEKNNPIAGASVTIKGSAVGTAADSAGNFMLTLPPEARTLVISSVGYNSQEVNIAGQTSLSIVLVSPSQALTDVVVV